MLFSLTVNVECNLSESSEQLRSVKNAERMVLLSNNVGKEGLRRLELFANVYEVKFKFEGRVCLFELTLFLSHSFLSVLFAH